MKLVQVLLLATLTCATSIVSAADGQFDRSAEIQKFKQAYADVPIGALAEVSKEVFISGLSDPTLAQIVRDRLLNENVVATKSERIVVTSVVWTVKALASFGIEEHREALVQLRNRRNLPGKVRTEIKEEIDRFDWHKRKNEIMASTRNHQEGANPRVSRYLNLIMDDDFSYKYMGADRINYERLLEPRVTDAMAAQLLQYKDGNFPSGAGKMPTKTLGLYAKLLGYSGDSKYRDVLQQILDSKSNMLVKKHARQALERLK